MKRALLCWLLLFISVLVLKSQQDPQFSQNKLNLTAVNPGSSGASNLINIYLLNRFQWVGFPGAPVTTVFNVDASVRLIGKNDGLGMSIMNDVIGYEKNVSVGINYAWRKKIGTGNLGSGISLGILSKNLRPGWAEMEGSDNVNLSDPAIPMKETNGVVADIGAGLFFQQRNYYLSLSAKHLNQPSYSYEQNASYSIRRHYYFMGGYNIKMKSLFEMFPSLYLKTDANAWQADIDVLLQYDKRIWGGLGVRPGDAVKLMMGTELRNGLRFSYAYDLSTSALSRYNSGSHELFLSYSVLLGKKKTHKYKSIRFL